VRVGVREIEESQKMQFNIKLKDVTSKLASTLDTDRLISAAAEQPENNHVFL
jgi:hypothetical protein